MREIKQKRTRDELVAAHAKLLETCCVKDDQIDELKNANLVLQYKLKDAYRTEYKNKRFFDLSFLGCRLISDNPLFTLFTKKRR